MSENIYSEFDQDLDDFINKEFWCIKDYLSKREKKFVDAAAAAVTNAQLNLPVYFAMLGAISIVVNFVSDPKLKWPLVFAFCGLWIWYGHQFAGLKGDCGVEVYGHLYRKKDIEEYIDIRLHQELAACDDYDYETRGLIKKRYAYIKEEFPYWRFI